MRMIPKINHTQIKSIWKSVGELEKDFTQNPNLQYRFCPFTIILGALNSSETGYKNLTSIPNDYTSFSKIFTGREAILSVWDNSYDLIEPDLKTLNSKGKKKGKVGDVFYGQVVSDQVGIAYSASPANNNFIQEQAVKNVVINIPNQEKNFDFINNILSNTYKLYMLPEINAIRNEKSYTSDRQWYFIEVATKIYNNETKEIAYIQATFSSLNDKLSTSGLAINQYVQLGAPGEPAFIPKLDIHKNIILDPDYDKPRPVTHCQVTFYGNAGKIAIGLWGRNIQKDDSQTITMNPTKLIFPYQYQCSNYDPVSFSALPETNYVMTVSAKNTIDTYQQWQKVVAPLYDDNTQKTFEGHILTDVTATTATNPLGTDTGKYLPYWDNNFLNNVNLGNDTFFTTSNPYFCFFNKDLKVLRGKINGYIPNNLKFKNLRNLNALNYFLYNSLNEIPTSVRETTKVNLNTIPIFGSFFNFFSGGMDIGFKLTSNLIIPKFDVVNFFMSAELYRFYTTVFYASESVKNIMPYDIFRNSTPDSISAILGTSSHMTSFTFNLTDRMNISNYNLTDNSVSSTNYKDLVNISQINPDNENEIQLLPNEQNFDLQAPVFDLNQYTGYYIDLIDIYVVGKCNFKLNFYSMPDNYNGAVSDDFSIWSGIYQTVGKASGNIKLIKNTFILANNTYSFKNKYRYPQQVNPPPAGQIKNMIFIDISKYNFDNSIGNSWDYQNSYYVPIDSQNYHDWTQDISIDITEYDYDNLNDFLNDYKSLQINLNYTLTSYESDSFINTYNSSSPIIIDDLKNIPINSDDSNRYMKLNGLAQDNVFSYYNFDTHTGNNFTYMVERDINPYKINYNITPTYDNKKFSYIWLGDTNYQKSQNKQTVTFVQLYLISNFNPDTKKLNMTFNFIGTLIAFSGGGQISIGGIINFNNIQIAPRVP